MAPNFFILFSPGALRDVPATYMTSFYLAPQDKPFLNQLLAAFPTVTVIEVDKVIAQIQSIVGRVTQAVQLVLALVLVAGCLVLVASIQASGEERLREHALLRALGASRRLVRGALGAEFALLGLFAGLIAAFGAEVTVFGLDKQIFQLSPRLHPWVWFAGPVRRRGARLRRSGCSARVRSSRPRRCWCCGNSADCSGAGLPGREP